MLVRRAAVPRIGFWALPRATWMLTSSLEEAVVREIEEETGIVVVVSGLHDIAPLAGWNERRGHLDRLPRRSERRRVGCRDDVSDARWFAPTELPWAELAFDSTAQFLRDWIESLK